MELIGQQISGVNCWKLDMIGFTLIVKFLTDDASTCW